MERTGFGRRNALKGRDASAIHREHVRAALLTPRGVAPAASVGERPPAAGALSAVKRTACHPGSSRRIQDAWVSWLAPHFAENASAYFTGTYREAYGIENGLTLVRNVHKDFRRFLKANDIHGDFVVAAEPHRFRSRYRDGKSGSPWRHAEYANVLHLHAVMQGPFTPADLQLLNAWWQVDRGHARVLPVLDGAMSYVAKYALKADSDAFDWRLSPRSSLPADALPQRDGASVRDPAKAGRVGIVAPCEEGSASSSDVESPARSMKQDALAGS